MKRIVLLLATQACDCSADSDTDGGPSDTDEAPEAFACDYPELAGNWVGETFTEQGVDYPVAITAELYSPVAEGERVGTATFIGSLLGEDIECHVEFICVGRDQNEWRVVMERSLPESVGTACMAGWAFLQAEQDGGLRYEFTSTEFGERKSSAQLSWVD